jgi:S1-C subfamily serine protease
MSRWWRRLSGSLSLVSFVSGILGGALVLAAAAVVLATSRGFGSSTTTVTVQETPILSAGASRRAGGLTAHQVYERAASGVVFVSANNASAPQSAGETLRGEGGQPGTATGSGFEIDRKGTILTNWHVIEGATKVTVTVDGRTLHASVLGDDPSNDLAVLHILTDGLTLHPLTLGNSSTVQVGDSVLAIGNPFGLTQTLTTGVISALGRRITAPNGVTIDDALQTDAPINPGNSGGPLLNEQGEVIGINSQIETSGERGGSVGIAFAIPVDTAKNELPTLEKG